MKAIKSKEQAAKAALLFHRNRRVPLGALARLNPRLIRKI
jgi:hypothetical protein